MEMEEAKHYVHATTCREQEMATFHFASVTS
jgi:hypothetical protein